MKKKSLFLTVFLTLSLSFSTIFANSEELSCDDLVEVAEALESVRENFHKVGQIREGDSVDEALGQVVDGLNMIADAEQDRSLTRSVDALSDAYDNMDSEHFLSSIDSVIYNIDRLYLRDCE